MGISLDSIYIYIFGHSHSVVPVTIVFSAKYHMLRQPKRLKNARAADMVREHAEVTPNLVCRVRCPLMQSFLNIPP